MKINLVKTAVAVALGSASLLSQAATVNLSDWAFGDGNKVKVGAPSHSGLAGGFKGSVQFAAGGELGFSVTLTDFITYCVEIEENFHLPSGDMSGYSVFAGADYSKWVNPNNSGNTALGTSNRLGQLLSYVGSNSTLVDSAAESTSLQLAIWNIIYDNDADLDTPGLFASTRSDAHLYNPHAETLLANSAGVANTLDVFVLSRDGKQDFLLTRPSTTPGDSTSQVPEPASMALAMLALAAAGASSRRRRA